MAALAVLLYMIIPLGGSPIGRTASRDVKRIETAPAKLHALVHGAGPAATAPDVGPGGVVDDRSGVIVTLVFSEDEPEAFRIEGLFDAPLSVGVSQEASRVGRTYTFEKSFVGAGTAHLEFVNERERLSLTGKGGTKLLVGQVTNLGSFAVGGSRVWGRVTDRDSGAFLSGIRVKALGEGQALRHVRTGRDGTFQFKAPPGSRWQVQAVDLPRRYADQRAVVGWASDRSIEVHLAKLPTLRIRPLWKGADLLRDLISVTVRDHSSKSKTPYVALRSGLDCQWYLAAGVYELFAHYESPLGRVRLGHVPRLVVTDAGADVELDCAESPDTALLRLSAVGLPAGSTQGSLLIESLEKADAGGQPLRIALRDVPASLALPLPVGTYLVQGAAIRGDSHYMSDAIETTLQAAGERGVALRYARTAQVTVDMPSAGVHVIRIKASGGASEFWMDSTFSSPTSCMLRRMNADVSFGTAVADVRLAGGTYQVSVTRDDQHRHWSVDAGALSTTRLVWSKP